MMAAARTAATATPAAVADEDEAEPVYTAVLYEAHLEHADESEPLWRVPYFGQVVRIGTAEAIFAKRRSEHERDAAREDKDLGLHAVIDRFGPEAMAWRIVSSDTGPRTAMQALANAEEIRLIDENGGILRDMDAKLKQTLNLTKGGRGDPRAVWEAIDARRKRAYTKFQEAMEKYVKEYKSALVPREYVDEDGYPLGTRLSSFRQGKMRKGTPWEDEAKAWAKALPKWYWDARKSDKFCEGRKHCGQERSQKAYVKFKAAMAKYVEKHESALVPRAYVDEDDGYSLGTRLNGFRQGEMWKGTPWEDEAKAWTKTLPKFYWDARESDEYREGLVRLDKLKKTMATDASKAKRRKIFTAHHQKEVRVELERARTIAVPFEKSQKRRAEMRALSTDFSGLRGNPVLYMISKDGKTIRRVDKNGNMREKDIVGPVVDPPPVAEAGPSDLNAYVSESESD